MNTKHNRGLALISLLILIGCILVIGGVIVILLGRLAKRALEPKPPSTNTVEMVTITLPQFTFPPLPAPPDRTPEKPIGSCYAVIERCTNPFAPVWIPVMTNYGGDVSIPDHDPEVPMEFYRAKFVYP